MQRFIKSIGWLLIIGVCASLASMALAQQPVKIEPAGEGAWRLTTTLMGQADRIDWPAEDAMSGSFQVDRPPLEWTNHPGYVEIRWVVRSETPLEIMTGLLIRVFEDQTEAVRVNIDPALEVIGPIQSGMTLWGIANGWLDGWNEVAINVGGRGDGQRPRPTMPEWMDQIMQANPQAFETNQASSLMRGAMLRHPIERRLTTPSQPVDALPEQADQTRVIESELSQPSANLPVLNDSLDVDVFESQPRMPEQTHQDTEPSNTETHNTETSNIEPVGSGPSPMDFGFLDQPDWWQQEQHMGKVALVLGLVVVCLLLLHGWSKVGGMGRLGEHAPTQGGSELEPSTMTPEAVTMTLDLAERYLVMGDAAQALHWLEEVIAYGTPKEVRHAKRLWRQALALIHGVSEPGTTVG